MLKKLTAVHFIEKKDEDKKLKEINAKSNLWESGDWSVSEARAQELVGGKIYIHKAQRLPSHKGGTVQSYEKVSDTRFKFVFVAEEGCENVTEVNWPAGEKKFIWSEVPNYYVIGSKYGGNSNSFKDVLPLMIKSNVIAVGFNFSEDMSEFLGKSQNEIVEYLKNKNEPKESYSTLKHFLSLKPGDLIAVKLHSAPQGNRPRLVIGAYAVVKGIEKPLYRHSAELGHTIEVDFIDTEINYEVPFGYGGTIHKIESVDRINAIFSHYSAEAATSEEVEVSDVTDIDDVLISRSARYISRRVHNRIQKKLLHELRNKYGISAVKPEVNYIDILVELEDKYIIFEVKSSLSAERCIREALGQILQYGSELSKTTNKTIEYVVVGPNTIDDSAESYYKFVVENISIPLSYTSFSA
ncbi:hypothetical protein H5162_00675 [Pseudoalteromonas sp. SR41-8]|uniref:hypothetical protein n=1 Tax=Pseudoalteromonas sp. SR41-8 TaxID=2760946 RepID=UPI00160377ED|nr:hypothetical protein [Pseudoalteromonas sp. SR41-8]MBB1307961.1 hypothetical protein [Pseudoalteromonas sp. SR41-8]